MQFFPCLYRGSQKNVILKKCNNVYETSLRIRTKTDDVVLTLRDVTKLLKAPNNREYVPIKYFDENVSQETLKHLRWMVQKDVLGQDMFLIGAPGSRRRNLAMVFSELTEREVEFVSLSHDTTEADLKQRREIKNRTATYHDQSALRAAINGRVLILEGIEKAERNVLPVLNNLFENREMHLEDGRFLIPAKRYDKLLKDHGQKKMIAWKLVRVSEEFRVIALGLPVPRYPGYPLDPPLRSRFQARYIQPKNYQEELSRLEEMAPNVPPAALAQLLSCCYALATEEAVSLGLPEFPVDSLPSAAAILNTLQEPLVHDVFYRFYPYKLFLNQEGQRAVQNILQTFGIVATEFNTKDSSFFVRSINNTQDNHLKVTISYCGQESSVEIPTKLPNSHESTFVETDYQNSLIAKMLLSHSALDLCLVGPRGCGKSATVRRLAELLNYSVEPIMLYQDMTSRDLIQHRTTDAQGDTVWRNSPLVTAALEGKLAILDGLHRVHSSTLSVIHRLVHDRELQLHDGKRLLRADRYDEIKKLCEMSDDDMGRSSMYKIHPSFKIIGLAEPPKSSSPNQWLNSELLNTFVFHEMRPLGKEEELHIIREKFAEPPESLLAIVELAQDLRRSKDPILRSLASSFSTRQLLRIASRMLQFPGDDPYEVIHRACLARFLPTVPKEALEDRLKKHKIFQRKKNERTNTNCLIQGSTVTIGETSFQRYETSASSKVPDILFYDVPQHLSLIEILAQDFMMGQHLLLVGNQGVGKNKIIDRLLQLLNRPREYIQLHRDTTVQTLTVQPMVRDGVVVFEDSPLVQAVKSGHVLVVDEGDKAPTHVTCILKTLVESGEMILSDGRKIVPASMHDQSNQNTIPLHPDFRMIVLANRPGFPFLGNDFFGAIGDLFSTHSVENPSTENEIQLLKQYAPDVDQRVLEKLVGIFDELRRMADQGLVTYPYSTREVVNIVKHLQEFPQESLVTVVRNVFDFDKCSRETYATLTEVLHKHGIPVDSNPRNTDLAQMFRLPASKLITTCNIRDSYQTMSVQKRPCKYKMISNISKEVMSLDRNEARSAMFTELEVYWNLPLNENSIVASLCVSPRGTDQRIDDSIRILTINPLSLFDMSINSKYINKIDLQGFIRTERRNKPQFSLAVDKNQNILVHEETSNELLSIDLVTGTISSLQSLSMLNAARDKLSQVFTNHSSSWRLKSDLLLSHNHLLLFTPGGNQIEVIDLESMTTYAESLPFNLKSFLVPSPDRWLLEDLVGNKFILLKDDSTNPCPNILREVDEGDKQLSVLGSFLSCNKSDLVSDSLDKTLGQKISSPNRIFATSNSYATVAVGFPDSDHSNQMFSSIRDREIKSLCLPMITSDGSIVRIVRSLDIPLLSEHSPQIIRRTSACHLEITHTAGEELRYIPVPTPTRESPMVQWLYGHEPPIYAAQTSSQSIITVDLGGCVRLWEISLESQATSLRAWKKMIGGDDETVQVSKSRYSGKDVTAPKHGKVDPKNEPHVGGNTWAGGTGGRDTAGLGGKGGPYRLDAGHTVHQLSDEEKNAVPDHVKKAAREMGAKAFKQRLQEIKMSEYDHELYSQFSKPVQKEVQALRVILESLQTKSKERDWCRHQTSGDLDDTKLIEGLTGEKTIYRRRAEKDPEIGTPQLKPKRMKIVVDVSGSMYRFNGHDERLTREMEACTMVMEAFHGYETKLQYDIVGHSGDSFCIPFVERAKPPTDNKQRLQVLKNMHAHSQFCMSGDHTVEATQHAISSLAKEDSDESIVIVLSDANLERYGIRPEAFARTLASHEGVSAYAIFIGSLGDQAIRLSRQMPSGRAYVCMDLKNIPRILQQIFTASLLKSI